MKTEEKVDSIFDDYKAFLVKNRK